MRNSDISPGEVISRCEHVQAFANETLTECGYRYLELLFDSSSTASSTPSAFAPASPPSPLIER
jgi:hypothetical protein